MLAYIPGYPYVGNKSHLSLNKMQRIEAFRTRWRLMEFAQQYRPIVFQRYMFTSFYFLSAASWSRPAPILVIFSSETSHQVFSLSSNTYVSLKEESLHLITLSQHFKPYFTSLLYSLLLV